MDIKQQFVKMCGLVEPRGDKYYFPFEEVECQDHFKIMRESANFPILIGKMKNLIKIVNENPDFVSKDIEDELWDMI